MIPGVSIPKHEHIFADALRTERRTRKARRHREKIDSAAIAHRQDRRHLGALNIHAADGDVEFLAPVRREHLLQKFHGFCRVRHDDLVRESHLPDICPRTLRVDVRHDVSRRPYPLHGLIATQKPRLPTCTQNKHPVTGLHELCRLRGRTRHVERRQREPLIHILGEFRIDAGLKKNRLTFDFHAVDVSVHREDSPDFKRCERERHKACDLVARPEIALRERGANLRHAADEHAPRTGDGVLLLAARRDDVHDNGLDFLLIAVGLTFDLCKTGRVDIQRQDIHQNFVVIQFRHVIIEFLRGLRHGAGRFKDTMRSILVAIA